MDTDNGLVLGGAVTAMGWERSLAQAAPLGHEVEVGWSADYRSFYLVVTRDGSEVALLGVDDDSYGALPFVASLLRAAAALELEGVQVRWLAEADLLPALLRAPALVGGFAPVERVQLEREAVDYALAEGLVDAEVLTGLAVAVASVERPARRLWRRGA